jgi:hypothetical protein
MLIAVIGSVLSNAMMSDIILNIAMLSDIMLSDIVC